MGDMGEIWKETKEMRQRESREKRSRNYQNAIKLLDGKKIPYRVTPSGNHLIIDNQIDFWPTTGKFINRKNRRSGRGVFNMLRVYDQEK